MPRGTRHAQGKSWHGWRAWLARQLAWAAGSWIAVTVSVVLLLRWVDPPSTAFMMAAALDGTQIRQQWVAAPAIPREFALAAVAAEDQRFPRHFGFDLVEIEKALSASLKGGRLRGASTISQQVAKNLFLWSGRNMVRKGLEAYFTVLLETLWPKRRILEVYLNIAQFGEGIYGIGAASHEFFATGPERLTRRQISLLVAVLPNPTGARPNAPDDWVLRRAAFVRKHMRSLGGVGYLDTM